MPQVGSGKTAQKFPYTPAGEKQATKVAKQTGQKVKNTENFDNNPPKRGKGK